MENGKTNKNADKIDEKVRKTRREKLLTNIDLFI